MTQVVSTRLEEKEVEILNNIAEKEYIDRSALIRKFLLQQIKEYGMHDMAEKYRKGLVSMAEAASVADVSIYEMMEYCQREKIFPPMPSEDELRAESEEAAKVFQALEEGKIH